MSRSPHTTDPQDPRNLQVSLMAELGFFTRAISRVTGLSESQVNYRTRLYGIKRSEYRNGSNEAASRILSSRVFKKTERKKMAADYDSVRDRVLEKMKRQRANARRKSR